VAEVAQTLPESRQKLRGRAPTMEQTNPVYLCRLLRRGGERRHEDTEGEDEHAPNDATTHGGALQHTRAPSQWVSRSSHPRIDPGQVGWLALEETADGVPQHGVGGLGVEMAGLLERQDTLHPPVACAPGRSQRAFAPQDTKSQCALRPVVRRV